MFLMCIRSPKTIKEYSVKLETFFDFIVNNLGEMEFKTDDIETKCSILYKRSRLFIFANELLYHCVNLISIFEILRYNIF